MNDEFISLINDIVKEYDKILLLYKAGDEICRELQNALENISDKRRLLIIFPSGAFRDYKNAEVMEMTEEDISALFQLYSTYHFADNFILYSDWEGLPYPCIFGFSSSGVLSPEETAEAMLQ